MGWGGKDTGEVREGACFVSHGGAKGFGLDPCHGEPGRDSGRTDMIAPVFWKDPRRCCVEGG